LIFCLISKIIIYQQHWSTMRKNLSYILIFLTFLLFACPQRNILVLVLNFDINQTIIAIDTVEGKDDKLALAIVIAKKTKGDWDPSGKQSYYDYVKANNTDKEQRNELYRKFIEDYDKEYEGNLSKELAELKASYAKQNTIVFRSFFNLLEYLKNQNIYYHLVFRTFGKDGPEILKIIEPVLNVKFARAEFKQGNLVLSDGKILKSPSEIAKYINTTPYLIIRDEWEPWGKAKLKEDWHFGKKFYFSVVTYDHKTMLPIFLDDNIEPPGVPNNIVQPIKVVGDGFTHVDPGELFEKQIFPVNTGKAIMDKNYFINIIKAALNAYGH
jgi:hypothetical protein